MKYLVLSNYFFFRNAFAEEYANFFTSILVLENNLRSESAWIIERTEHFRYEHASINMFVFNMIYMRHDDTIGLIKTMIIILFAIIIIKMIMMMMMILYIYIV